MPTINDATVVASAYDTSGNGGRKLVKTSNGNLFSVMRNGTTEHRIYKSVDNGVTWTLIKTVAENTFSVCIETNGTDIYIFQTFSTNMRVRRIDQNGTTLGSQAEVDSGQSDVQGVSAIVNEARTELYATWASKNATYPNSWNIRYAKGTINADGTVTWGTVEQLTTMNTTGYDFKNPTISVQNGSPMIVCEMFDSAAYHIIYMTKGNTTQSSTYASYITDTWGNKDVHRISSYAQSSPSAIFVPQSINGLANGRIWVAWRGYDSTDTTTWGIKVSYSDDGGATWSVMTKITSVATDGTQFQMNPSMTFAKNGDVWILWHGGNTSTSNYLIRMVKYSSNAWGAKQEITNGSANMTEVSALLDSTLNFSSPLFIYKANTLLKVGFYGTWTVTTISVTQGSIGLRDDVVSGNLTSLGTFTFDTNISTYTKGQTYTITVNSASRTLFDNAKVRIGDYITHNSIIGTNFLTIIGISGYTLTVYCNIDVTDGTPTTWSDELIARPSRLLTYTITTDGTMSTITEKVNGVTIGTKTATSGQSQIVGLSQAQWDEIAFGKYAYRNLAQGFNSGKWVFQNATINSNSKITVNTIAIGETQRINIPVKPNTPMTVKAVLSDQNVMWVGVAKTDGVTLISDYTTNSVNTFNTGNNTEIQVIFNMRATGVNTIENVMVNEGSTAKPYVPFGADNTLTVEMGSEKWTYTFDKRLATSDDILSAVKATQDAQNTYLPAVKSKLASAVRAKGGTVNDTDSFEAIASAVGGLGYTGSGRKATGTTSSNASARLLVTGLSFTPKIIVTYNSANRTYSLYESNTSETSYIMHVKASISNDSSTVSKGSATITPTSFDISVGYTSSSFTWWAFE